MSIRLGVLVGAAVAKMVVVRSPQEAPVAVVAPQSQRGSLLPRLFPNFALFPRLRSVESETQECRGSTAVFHLVDRTVQWTHRYFRLPLAIRWSQDRIG